MRATTLMRLVVLWPAILCAHLFSPTTASEVITILFLVLLFIDWVRPPNSANLVAAGNLLAALTLAFDAIVHRPLQQQLVSFMVIAIAPLVGARVRCALRAT